MVELNKLCSGMLSDELDKMGYRNQVIQGLVINKEHKIFSIARTIKIEELETDDENIRTGLGFIGSINKGEILCVQGSQQFAYFGELMTRLSIRQGLGGVVIGGFTRDSEFTQHTKLPIFSQGYTCKDIKGRGRVQEVDTSITIQGVEINPGDYIFGDLDGVVVVPKECKEELEQRLLQVILNENNIVRDITEGKSIEFILNTYKEF